GAPPITPYPTQLAYGALAAGMLYVLTRNREPRIESKRWRIANSPLSILYLLSSIISSSFALSLFVLCSVFFVLYRAQPPYPYPLRGFLPALDAALAALLARRYGRAAARRVPALLDGLALGGIGAG